MNDPFDIPIPPDEPLVAPGSLPDLEAIAEHPQEQTKLAPETPEGSISGGQSAAPKPLDNPVNIIPGPETAPVGDVVTTQLDSLPAPPKAKFDIYSRLLPGKERGSIDGLTPGFRSNLSQMIEQAPPEIQKDLHILSGFRSVERQTQLWNDAVAKYGSPEAARKWVAPPGSSKHNAGEAVDLSYGTPAARKWAHDNAARFGLNFRLSNEDWHIEPAKGTPAFIPDASMPAGMRNNNPGNMKFIPRLKGLYTGVVGPSTNTDQGDPQAVFATPEDGMRAMVQLAMKKYDSGRVSTNALIAGEGGWTPGHTQAAANIARSMGLRPDQDMNLKDPEQQFKFARALMLQEHGEASKKYPDQMVRNAIAGRYGSTAPPADFYRNMDPARPADVWDMTMPPRPPVAGKWTEATQEALRLANGQEKAGFFDALSFHMKDNITGRLLSQKDMVPVPGHVADVKALTEGIPEQYWGRFGKSVSPAHDTLIREEILRTMDMEEKLSAVPMKSGVAAVLAAIIDPAAWAIGSASGGGGVLMANLGRFGIAGSRASAAAAAGAGNIGLTALSKSVVGDEATTKELVTAGLLGAGFGVAFGPIGRNPVLMKEAVELEALLKGQAKDLNSALHASASPTALEAGSAAGGLPGAVGDIAQSDVAKGLFGSVRFSEGGRLATSNNPVSRLIGSFLGVDTVGKGGLVNPTSADQIADRLTKRDFTAWRGSSKPAFDKWSEDRGIGAVQRTFGSGWANFNEEVGAYIRSKSPYKSSEFHPSVVQAGDAAAKILAERAKDLKNPLREANLVGRPVFGAENLTEDPNFLPRLWSPSKGSILMEAHGEDTVARLITGSLLRASPEMDTEVANSISRYLLRSPRLRAMGVDERLDSMLTAKSLEPHMDFMEKELKLTKAQIDGLTEMVGRGEGRAAGKTADLSNLKHRLDLDETYSMKLPDGSELKITDLLENNVDSLMNDYIRRTSGRIAMAQNRVFHPDGKKLLLDGVTSDAEFDQLVKMAQDWAVKNKVDPAVIKREVESMEWMRDRILGVPDPAALGETAAWLRLIRTYNFSRLMGQMGFAQTMDSGAIIGAVGVRSFAQHMGGFRHILNMDGKMVLRHGLDRELEAIFGSGSDGLRSFHALVVEGAIHMRAFPGSGARSRILNKAQEIADVSAQGVSALSGMNTVNSWLQLAFGRAAAQKFANIASAGPVSKANRNLLNFLGLSPEMSERVFSQIRTHFHHENGWLFGRKVAKMNLDKWDDLEAAASFTNALYRWSHHVVQENDVGAMHRVMSHPLAQTMAQFRVYSLTAWENQVLHQIANPNMRTAASTIWSTMTGALVYAVQTNLQAIGRSDKEEFLRSKGLGPDLDFRKLGPAIFQRSGWSSILPMVLDTGGMMAGVGPMFNARTSGQASDLIFGSPTTGLFGDIGKASKAIGKGVFGSDRMSQSDARNISRLAPWQNSLPLANIYSSLISDRSAPQLRQ